MSTSVTALRFSAAASFLSPACAISLTGLCFLRVYSAALPIIPSIILRVLRGTLFSLANCVPALALADAVTAPLPTEPMPSVRASTTDSVCTVSSARVPPSGCRKRNSIPAAFSTLLSDFNRSIPKPSE